MLYINHDAAGLGRPIQNKFIVFGLCMCDGSFHSWIDAKGQGFFWFGLLWFAFFCGIPVPGILVPNATKAIAVTVSLRPKVQPMCEERSPITAVRNPISRMDMTKATYPS